MTSVHFCSITILILILFDYQQQVSAEQRRIADLMTDKTDISELQSKVEKIIELTNATRDEAVVALHDCDNELDRAIDMILEGESVNVTEWRSTGKKRKPKVVASSTSQADKEDKSNANGRFDCQLSFFIIFINVFLSFQFQSLQMSEIKRYLAIEDAVVHVSREVPVVVVNLPIGNQKKKRVI